MSSLEGGVDSSAGTGLLTLVSPAAGFTLGGSDASSDAASLSDGSGVVFELIEGEEGDGFSERLVIFSER